MKVSFEEIKELSSQLVRFYSVKIGSAKLSEFEQFDEKEITDPNHIEERNLIFKTINQIRMRGAKRFFFRPEGPAFALPGLARELTEKDTVDFGIRLYVVLINDEHVILLNGDVKTKTDPKDCPNVSLHFNRALKLASKVAKAILDGNLEFGPEGLEVEEDFEIDI